MATKLLIPEYIRENFSLVIIELLGPSDSVSKLKLIEREQYYIDLYNPVLNLNPLAGSSLSFKHSEKTMRLCLYLQLKKVNHYLKVQKIN